MHFQILLHILNTSYTKEHYITVIYFVSLKIEKKIQLIGGKICHHKVSVPRMY